MTKVIVKNAPDLTSEELAVINAWRKKEFNSDTILGGPQNKPFYDSVFFLNKEGEKIVAFGRLRPLEVYIGEKKYEIWGIAMIAAVEKFKGYGKQLMFSIKDYVKKYPRTMIGFCGKSVSEFYLKCGYSILYDAQKYFVHIDEQGKKHYEDEDVLYLEGPDDLIKQLSSSNPPMITHYVPHW
ncbi:MAG: GNAT family N-acetyltransferase [Patescibacteria group bacterium]|jgi:hypothetical protein